MIEHLKTIFQDGIVIVSKTGEMNIPSSEIAIIFHGILIMIHPTTCSHPSQDDFPMCDCLRRPIKENHRSKNSTSVTQASIVDGIFHGSIVSFHESSKMVFNCITYLQYRYVINHFCNCNTQVHTQMHTHTHML